MELHSKKIALLVADNFEQAELEIPYTELHRLGAVTTIVSLDHKQLHALQGLKPGDTFKADALLSEVTPSDYDALLLPGGICNADIIRTSERAQTWVRDFLERDRLVAAIGYAVWLLISADALDGRRLTSYPTMVDDVENAGGEWADQMVVIDDSLITSRHAEDIPAFLEAFMHQLTHRVPDNALAEDVEDTLAARGMKLLGTSKDFLAAIRKRYYAGR